MAIMQKPLMSKRQLYLKRASWSVWIREFNKIHNPTMFTSIGNVDGSASAIIRLTAIPDSSDIIPVRNQILEIDFVNTTINGTVDTTAVGDTSAGATETTTSSYTAPSSY